MPEYERSTPFGPFVTEAYVMRSMIGILTHHTWAVSVEHGDDLVVVHMALTERYEELDEDVEDILGELEAQFSSEGFRRAPRVEMEVYVGAPTRNWPGARFQHVYRIKS